MTDLSYHLEKANDGNKNDLGLRLISAAQKKWNKESLLCQNALSSSEKMALEILFKQKGFSFSTPFCISSGTFALIKLLGTTGRLFYQNKKIFVDPFSSYEIYLEADRLESGKARFSAYWSLGSQAGPLDLCEWIFPAQPSWILHQGIIRPIKEEILKKWVSQAVQPFEMQGAALTQFLEEIEGEIPIHWRGQAQEKPLDIDPFPFLILTDRHGGFANLGFDYGLYGKVAAHDPTCSSFRHQVKEKEWEKDLLETDFIKKIVEKSHYYCPLDKVGKSLTFLLEIGWTILDAAGKRVLRQKKIDFDIDAGKEKILFRAKVSYGDHSANLKDLVGAFNRRENFVELSSNTVALIDRQEFSSQWGDLTEQEIVAEGVCLKKNQLGLLMSFLDRETLPCREEVREKIARLCACQPEIFTGVGKDFQGTLFPYQVEGLQWLKFLMEGGFGGLLADEMGLGKTVQVVALFSLLPREKPFLIIVPTSLVFNWQKEIEKFLPSLAIYRHEGKERLRTSGELKAQQVILTSYALLRIDFDLFKSLDYQVLILDEAQAIKNPESQTAQLCCSLNSETRLAITGTPIENRLEDLWSIFRFLQPDLLGEKSQFQFQMQAAQLSGFYLDKVKKKIRPFILRRKKEQVCLQLPPKLEQTVYIEMSEPQRECYERFLQDTKQGLLQKVTLDGASPHRMEILEAILRLRQICAHPALATSKEDIPSAKLERLISDLHEVVSEKRKVLVYSQFTKMLALIENEIKQMGCRWVYLDGSTKDREKAVQQFQEDPETSIFLISLKAGGVGLNLTAADYIFLYDPWWNEAVERQAIDRAHRLGKTTTVIARRYIAALSIEEKIMRLKEHKKNLSQNLLEAEGDFNQVSLEDLLFLLE